jgi:DNA-binding response OmpR family regulator
VILILFRQFPKTGITDHIVRPVNLRKLVARVCNILHKKQPPFQFDGTAVFVDILILTTQNGKLSLTKTLCNLSGR